MVQDRVVLSEGVTLATAPVVVGGGRGVGSADGFAVLEALAAQARWRRGLQPCGDEQRLAPAQRPGRPDRHPHRSAAVHRVRHQRSDPALGRRESGEEDPRDQHRPCTPTWSSRPTTPSSATCSRSCLRSHRGEPVEIRLKITAPNHAALMRLYKTARRAYRSDHVASLALAQPSVSVRASIVGVDRRNDREHARQYGFLPGGPGLRNVRMHLVKHESRLLLRGWYERSFNERSTQCNPSAS